MAQLKDLGTIITGNTPKTSDQKNYNSLDIPFVKPSDISENEISHIDNSEFYISEYAREKARILPANSVLFTCIGIIGKTAINKVECAFNQQINAIIPDKNKCLTDYLVYALHSKKKQLQDIANAPVVPILNKTQFSEIEIPLPSLQEQKQIAINLNKISDLISLRKQQLSKLDELVKTRFVELFGDPIVNGNKKKLAEVGRIFTGNTPPMKETSYYESNDIPFIKPSDLKEIGVTSIEGVEAYISEKARPVARVIPPNSVLVTCIGTIGKVGIVTRESTCNQQINFIVPNENVNLVYLAHCLTFFKTILINMANAPVVPIINKTQFSELEIPVFGIEQQNQFATFVEQTDKSKLEVEQSLGKLETLKKSLMQQYFG